MYDDVAYTLKAAALPPWRLLMCQQDVPKVYLFRFDEIMIKICEITLTANELVSPQISLSADLLRDFGLRGEKK